MFLFNCNYLDTFYESLYVMIKGMLIIFAVMVIFYGLILIIRKI